MPSILIKHGNIITQDALLKDAALATNKGIIRSVGSRSVHLKSALTVNARGCFVAPGFIDTHIHGDPSSILSQQLQYGTTSIVVAISCCSSHELSKNINRIRMFRGKDSLGQSILGIRIEGPYISKAKAGAQNKAFIRRPSISGLRHILKEAGPLLKMITIAPELKGAGRLIRLLKLRGVIASIGHSNAAYEEAMQAIAAGVSHATHLFNAMSRDPGAVAAAIFGRNVKVEVIPDDIHVHPAHIDLVMRIKDKKDIIAVTDSVAAQPHKAKKIGGVYKLPDGTIAGSALTMIDAVRNLVRLHGLSVAEAVGLAASNPARLLGIAGRKGSIQAGKDADLVIFNKDFDVKMTIVRGTIVHRKRGF